MWQPPSPFVNANKLESLKPPVEFEPLKEIVYEKVMI